MLDGSGSYSTFNAATLGRHHGRSKPASVAAVNFSITYSNACAPWASVKRRIVLFSNLLL